LLAALLKPSRTLGSLVVQQALMIADEYDPAATAVDIESQFPGIA
jgi:hypothetical protein